MQPKRMRFGCITRSGQATSAPVELRGRHGWAKGRPTFEVGAHELAYRDGQSWPGPDRRPVAGLPLEAYWELYDSLPAYRNLERDTAAALAPRRAWVRAHPDPTGLPLVSGEMGTAQDYAAQLVE